MVNAEQSRLLEQLRDLSVEIEEAEADRLAMRPRQRGRGKLLHRARR